MTELRDLVTPSHTALVTQECQNGAIGQGALWPALAEAAAMAIPPIVQLVTAARNAGVPVIHCVVGKRRDLRGSNTNAPLYRAATKPARLEAGTAAAALIPDLAGVASDIEIVRSHGVSPMNGTGLDAILRNLGTRTVVACGVSVNVAITALCMDAVNASYRVVVPRDAVAGVPPDYAAQVVDNTISLLATVVSSGDVIRAWAGEAGAI